MNAPTKETSARALSERGVRPIEVHIPDTQALPSTASPDLSDPEAVRRRLLLDKVRDDRADMVKVVNAVREIAQTVEVAQSTLAMTRRSIRWLLLAGSAAAFTLWLTNGRRPRSALLAGLSMQAFHRVLRPGAASAPTAPLERLPAPRARVV